MMKPRAWLCVVAVLVVCFVAEAPSGSAAEPTFKRGASIVEFFGFPETVGQGLAKSYANPAYPHAVAALDLFDFEFLHRIGFDHMRVPLDVGPLMQGDEIQKRAILSDLATVIAAMHRHGLNVLVTLYSPSLHNETAATYLDGLDGPNFRAYVAIVERVAAALGSLDPGAVALEPMNEPLTKCRVYFGTDWSAYQQVMIERIRRIAPQLPLFLTGGCASNIEGIVVLDSDLLRDPRNFVSVHFYYPFLFTHQSTTWTNPFLAGTIGVPYPAAAGSLDDTLSLTRDRFKTVTLPFGADSHTAEVRAKAEIEKYFSEAQGSAQIKEWMNKVAMWQQRQQIDSGRIVFTEFGAMKQEIDGVEIDRASRARWLHDTASAIESQGWGWTVYGLRDGPFGVYRRESDRYPDPELMRALGLDAAKQSAVDDHHAGP